MNATEQLFTAFAKGLDATSVRHCFLRGYSEFPKLAPLSDVDMLVHPEDRDLTESAFRAAAGEAGFNVWQRFRSGFITRLFAYAYSPDDGHHFFDVDIHTSEASYGIPYLAADDLLPHVLAGEAIHRLPLPIEAMVNCLGHYFSGGSMPDKYRLPWTAHREDTASRALLEKAVGSTRAEQILSALAAGSPAPVLSNGRKVGGGVRRRLLLRHPITSAWGLGAFGWGERIRPWYRPRGRFLIFLGTDGSGKSTLVAELLKHIGPRFRGGLVEANHLRPGILPQISALFHGGRPAYTIEDMADPHRARPSGMLGSALRATYYWLDYLIGYPVRILPKRSRNSLIVFDRWFYDYLVDPMRFRVSRDSPLPGFLHRFLAKPDCVLICTAPPETILSRKQELSSDEVYRQVEQFRHLADRLTQASVIDTSQDLDRCVDEVIRKIFSGAGARS